LGKNKKLKDIITSSMSTIVDRTCCFFLLIKTEVTDVGEGGGPVLELDFQENALNGRKDTAKKVPCS
jgi:hypothetical protein